MKHNIKSQQRIDLHHLLVTVQLQPEDDMERAAIKNLEAMNASDNERELVENYLHFNLGLGNYSILQFLDQMGGTFNLKIFV